MATAHTPHEQALVQWTEHVSASRIEPDFFAEAIISKAYPDHHVTRTSPTTCDLLGYAKAGHATATQIIHGQHDATRMYRTPPVRLDGQSGKLEDVVSFGRCDYSWNGCEFIVYELTYIDRFARVTKVLYVLSPRDDRVSADGHNVKTDQLLLLSGEWTTEAHERIWVFDDVKWSKDKHLWTSVQETSWDDVIVSPGIKSKFSRDIDGFFDNRSLYQNAKIPWKRGIIFHGVPGVGKTLFIKILMKTLDQRSPAISTLYIKSLDACAGPKWSIQQIFRKARRTAPCLLVLEDLDSLVSNHTRSYFLNEVDGSDSNDGILMIGSTNHLEQLDPAVTRRPSRFDRKHHFGLPTEPERVAYCQYWCRKYIASDGVDFPEEICAVMAKLTEGFTFAYLKETFISSLLLYVGDTTNGSEGSTSSTAIDDMEGRSSLPEVDIPLHVRDNRLLRFLMVQTQSLLEDMNSTQAAVSQSSSTSAAANPQYRLPSLIDEADD